ncbi:zinc finger protein 37-like isoform X10 [Vespa velutina]|uniref:zinc finger protein 37-like isoform X10 n=1 Tax=Vespa velutina TaxID=202808 RepID=UPI001FB41201|nr:zinc finger protein 37-like isoform X10 [Vespa velutina]
MRTTPRSSPALVERVFASTGAAFASRAGVLHGKMSSLDYLDLCRLCLVKDRVSVPIFEGEGDVRQIFLKITACLPVKVDREDKLPKKICDDCVYKVELFYQFWNTSVNAEKQLLQWLGEVGLEEKPDYVTNVLNQNVMKPDPSGGNRLDGSMMQQVSGHQNNMGIGMMDNISLSMPMMMSTTNQQQITSVPMDASGSSVQEMPGTSTQSTHEQITQSQTNTSNQHEEEEESSEEEENSEDECDGEEGLPVKEESEEDPNNSRVIEPTTFVNVSLACDEAGPSGLQQQKVTEMPEMAMQQSTDGDPKSGKSIQQLDKRSMVKRRNSAIRSRWNVKKFLDESQASYSKDSRLKSINFRYERKAAMKILRSSSTLKKRSRVKEETENDNKSQSGNNETRTNQEILYKKRNDGNYTCDICQTIFKQKSKILRHIMSKHSFHRPFKCNACGKSFKYKCDLKAHRLIHQDLDTSLLHCCDKCDYRTKTKNNLKSHYIRRHTDDYKFACEHCGKRFKMEWDLKFHIGTHSSSRHMCDICGKFYTSDYSLYKHRKVAHLNEYNFQCDVCNKRLLTQENLNNHMRQHDRTYECKECGKVFATKRYLATHTTTHTGVKPYVCQICKKNFRTSHMRNTHLLTHSADRPHVCDLCGQAFKRRYYMIEHRRKHPDSHLSSPPMPFAKNRNTFEAKIDSKSDIVT